jgi:hypothetical protein
MPNTAANWSPNSYAALMHDGKKSVAESLLYGAFDIIEQKTKSMPVKVFEQALDNVRPMIEVKSRGLAARLIRCRPKSGLREGPPGHALVDQSMPAVVPNLVLPPNWPAK